MAASTLPATVGLATILMVFLLPGPVWARTPKLPATAPVPELQESATPNPPAAPPADVPVPEPRPGNAPAATEPEVQPEPGRNPPELAEPERKPILPDPRSAIRRQDKMPAEEMACRARLTALGAEFEDRKAEIDTAVGCSIPYPLALKKLGKSIDIAPEALLNCQMAEAAARFAADVVAPAAKAEFGAALKAIGQGSAYVCRPRHNGQKMSEHAFGNALDIARFTLSDGTSIEIGPVPPEKPAKFLNTVRKAACGPFKTVLGPGSDADHALHFHFDLEPRRNGGTFCQ